MNSSTPCSPAKVVSSTQQSLKGTVVRKINQPLNDKIAIRGFASHFRIVSVQFPAQVVYCKLLHISNMLLFAIQPTLKMGISFIKPIFLAVAHSTIPNVRNKNIQRPCHHADDRSCKISSTTMWQHMHQVPPYELRVHCPRYQGKRWGNVPVPWHWLENSLSPQSFLRHVFKRHTVGVCMTMGANINFQMPTRCSVCFGLERMIPSQPKEHQEKLPTRTGFNPFGVSHQSRLSTLHQQFVNNNIACFGALVELWIHLMRTWCNQKHSLQRVLSNPQQWPPRKLKNRLATVASPFITM